MEQSKIKQEIFLFLAYSSSLFLCPWSAEVKIELLPLEESENVF